MLNCLLDGQAVLIFEEFVSTLDRDWKAGVKF